MYRCGEEVAAVYVCVAMMRNLMNIFLVSVLKACVIDTTPKLFHVPAARHNLSVSEQDNRIFLGPILLTLFCAVTEYNDHHHIQWILLAFSQKFVDVEDSSAGIGLAMVWNLTWWCFVLFKWNYEWAVKHPMLSVIKKKCSGSAFSSQGPERG